MNFEDLVGVENLKSHISQLTIAAEHNKHVGIEQSTDLMLHTVFKGNPGTGKTTCARVLASKYHELGLLNRDKFVAVVGADLKGQLVGQTGPKIDRLLQEARGGVLFVDEAYSLMPAENNEDVFAGEALSKLMLPIEDRNFGVTLMFAGYPNEMDNFLKQNPYLLPRVMTLDLPDYSNDELAEMVKVFCKPPYKIEAGTDEVIKAKLAQSRNACEELGLPFSNARTAQNLFQMAVAGLASRTVNSEDQEMLTTITKADFEAIDGQLLR